MIDPLRGDREGPVQEPGYYFPARRVRGYLDGLPPSPTALEPAYLPPLTERIAIMTHDDEFDARLHEREQALGIEATWFLLTEALFDDLPEGLDVQLHFDKERGRLAEQIDVFHLRVGHAPRFNRTHRLFWRGDNFDYPLLASHGIAADSTRIGTRPYRPVVEGRVLPLWEIPFSSVDTPLDTKAIYNPGDSPSAPFRLGVSPAVILSHPPAVCERHQFRSCFDEAVAAARAHGYRFMSLSQFFDAYCRDVPSPRIVRALAQPV